MMFELRDIGFTTCMGIGGDPVVGTTHIDALEAFEKDPDTKVIVMIGEIGGDAEERYRLRFRRDRPSQAGSSGSSRRQSWQDSLSNSGTGQRGI